MLSRAPPLKDVSLPSPSAHTQSPAEAAGVSKDWCHLSSGLDTMMMNLSLGTAGSICVDHRVLRSCYLGRSRFGPSLLACLYGSDVSLRCPRSCRPDVCVCACQCPWAHQSHICQCVIYGIQRKPFRSSTGNPSKLIPWQNPLFSCVLFLPL